MTQPILYRADLHDQLRNLIEQYTLTYDYTVEESMKAIREDMRNLLDRHNFKPPYNIAYGTPEQAYERY